MVQELAVINTMNTIKKHLPNIKNLGLYFMSSIIVAMVGILLNPIFAMNLSHEDYAIMGYYSSFNLLLMPLLNFSLYSFYSRHYYFTPEEQQDNLGNTILLSSMLIGAVSLFVFVGVFYLLHNSTQNNFPFFPYAILTFVQVYIGNVTSFYLIRLKITRQAKKYAWFSIIQCILTAAFSLLFVVYYKYGATGKLLGTLIATIIASTYAIFYSITEFKIDKVIFKKALKFCTPLVISAIFWYFLTGIDRVFLERLNDTHSLGLYSIGLQMAGYLTIFYTTISSTFEPDIYQSIAQKRKKKLIGTIGIIVGFTAIVNIIFIILAPQIIGLLTANRYIESAPFAQILAVHNIIMACYYMVVKLLIGYGFVKQELFVRVSGALLSIVMFYYMIDRYQFIGAAWGQTLSFSILSILGLVVFYIYKKRDR